MQNGEKWAIRRSNGELLQSFAIDPAQISVGWFRPNAPGKTREGKKGPLTFQPDVTCKVHCGRRFGA